MSRRLGSAAELAGLPWRDSVGDGRPDLPLPPEPMPRRFAGRMRKRWRYVAAFSDELFICAARVQVGPAGQTFWAIVDRSTGEMTERTRLRLPGARGDVWSERADGSSWPLGSAESGVVTHLKAREAEAVLRIGEGQWAESVCPTAEGSYVWTRKRIAPISCDVRMADGRRWQVDAYGIEDESAGYHPAHTVWSWSAGVGVATDGRALGWNLVNGVNDPPERSERAIWVDGEPFEPGPVVFDDLDAIAFDDGSRLAFSPEAERRAAENKLIVRYTYRQPFGSFTGTLAGIPLERGWGVMEFHDAHW